MTSDNYVGKVTKNEYLPIILTRKAKNKTSKLLNSINYLKDESQAYVVLLAIQAEEYSIDGLRSDVSRGE